MHYAATQTDKYVLHLQQATNQFINFVDELVIDGPFSIKWNNLINNIRLMAMRSLQYKIYRHE